MGNTKKRITHLFLSVVLGLCLPTKAVYAPLSRMFDMAISGMGDPDDKTIPHQTEFSLARIATVNQREEPDLKTPEIQIQINLAKAFETLAYQTLHSFFAQENIYEAAIGNAPDGAKITVELDFKGYPPELYKKYIYDPESQRFKNYAAYISRFQEKFFPYKWFYLWKNKEPKDWPSWRVRVHNYEIYQIGDSARFFNFIAQGYPLEHLSLAAAPTLRTINYDTKIDDTDYYLYSSYQPQSPSFKTLGLTSALTSRRNGVELDLEIRVYGYWKAFEIREMSYLLYKLCQTDTKPRIGKISLKPVSLTPKLCLLSGSENKNHDLAPYLTEQGLVNKHSGHLVLSRADLTQFFRLLQDQA